LHFMVECFAACPDHLHIWRPAGPTEVVIQQKPRPTRCGAS
jgi:hypothetical protein